MKHTEKKAEGVRAILVPGGKEGEAIARWFESETRDGDLDMAMLEALEDASPVILPATVEVTCCCCEHEFRAHIEPQNPHAPPVQQEEAS